MNKKLTGIRGYSCESWATIFFPLFAETGSQVAYIGLKLIHCVAGHDLELLILPASTSQVQGPQVYGAMPSKDIIISQPSYFSWQTDSSETVTERLLHTSHGPALTSVEYT